MSIWNLESQQIRKLLNGKDSNVKEAQINYTLLILGTILKQHHMLLSHTNEYVSYHMVNGHALCFLQTVQ